MNKCFSFLLLCSGITLYAQNPSAKSMFDKNLDKANAAYEQLTQDEKDFCDVMLRNYAIQHARQAARMGQQALIPEEIDPAENLVLIMDRETELRLKLKNTLASDRAPHLSGIAAIRMAVLWKKKAETVGKKTTWSCGDDEAVFEDENFLK